MNILLAAMLAQSLWGDLAQEPAKEQEPAPVVQNAQAEQEVPAPAEVAPANAEQPSDAQSAPEALAKTDDIAQESKPEEAASENNAIVPTFSSLGTKIGDGPRSVKITSERTDYDRREGVIMFDKNVFVDDAEYKMHSDQLYVFLDGTNELKRIVAIGNVAITNETRYGSCAKAAYTKSIGKVVMYGDGTTKARLADEGKHRSEVEGKKITFWIDSEQVEVEGSTVTLDASGIGGKEGAKKLLGK